MEEQIIEKKIHQLPEELRKEVLDFIDFLLFKSRKNLIDKKKFNFDWEGGLSDLKTKYTSVELQHISTEWR
jgi:hypothetical protein